MPNPALLTVALRSLATIRSTVAEQGTAKRMAVNSQYSRVPHPAGSRFRSWTDFYPFYLGDESYRQAAKRGCSLGRH